MPVSRKEARCMPGKRARQGEGVGARLELRKRVEKAVQMGDLGGLGDALNALRVHVLAEGGVIQPPPPPTPVGFESDDEVGERTAAVPVGSNAPGDDVSDSERDGEGAHMIYLTEADRTLARILNLDLTTTSGVSEICLKSYRNANSAASLVQMALQGDWRRSPNAPSQLPRNTAGGRAFASQIEGVERMLMLLLNAGCDPNGLTSGLVQRMATIRESPSFQHVTFNEMVEALFGAFPHSTFLAIYRAIETGVISIVKTLVEDPRFDKTMLVKDMSPVSYAISLELADIAHYLVDAGFDVDYGVRDPLRELSYYGGDKEAQARGIIMGQPDPHPDAYSRRTFLPPKWLSLARKMVDKTAKLGHLVIRSSEINRMLIDKGQVDVDMVVADTHGTWICCYCQDYLPYKIVAADRFRSVELLLHNGASVNAAGTDGRTALHKAVGALWPEACQLLIDNGADPEARDKNGLTPLQSVQTDTRNWYPEWYLDHEDIVRIVDPGHESLQKGYEERLREDERRKMEMYRQGYSRY